LYQRSSSLDDTSKAIVIVGLVLGMQFAHLIGVVHRDLDPKNILLDEKGYVKIDGLGRSRFIEPDLALTTAVGTGVHMAPERDMDNRACPGETEKNPDSGPQTQAE
jgi:serine/threonine protein kinase